MRIHIVGCYCFSSFLFYVTVWCFELANLTSRDLQCVVSLVHINISKIVLLLVVIYPILLLVYSYYYILPTFIPQPNTER